MIIAEWLCPRCRVTYKTKLYSSSSSSQRHLCYCSPDTGTPLVLLGVTDDAVFTVDCGDYRLRITEEELR
jgi:hypothetical protein